MSDTNSPRCKLRVAVTRDDLAQFLYLVRSDMSRIVRQLDDIGRTLERMAARRSERLVPPPKPLTRR